MSKRKRVIDVAPVVFDARGKFVRVRSSIPGVLHEFDIPAALFLMRPDLFTVVDPVVVDVQRPVSYVVAVPVAIVGDDEGPEISES